MPLARVLAFSLPTEVRRRPATDALDGFYVDPVELIQARFVIQRFPKATVEDLFPPSTLFADVELVAPKVAEHIARWVRNQIATEPTSAARGAPPTAREAPPPKAKGTAKAKPPAEPRTPVLSAPMAARDVDAWAAAHGLTDLMLSPAAGFPGVPDHPWLQSGGRPHPGTPAFTLRVTQPDGVCELQPGPGVNLPPTTDRMRRRAGRRLRAESVRKARQADGVGPRAPRGGPPGPGLLPVRRAPSPRDSTRGAAGLRFCHLDGSTSAPERRAAVDRFQAGEADVFLLSMKAGGVGLNLTAASEVILLDPWWNPAVEDQAADRAHRIGQHEAVTVYRLVSRQTVEESILKLHDSKRDLAGAILAGTGDSGALSIEELMSLMSGDER